MNATESKTNPAHPYGNADTWHGHILDEVKERILQGGGSLGLPIQLQLPGERWQQLSALRDYEGMFLDALVSQLLDEAIAAKAKALAVEVAEIKAKASAAE